jgi:transcriptional regulator PpsR
MTGVSIAQPDVTLFLDLEGVIQSATLSTALADESVEAWVGRPWIETVADLGGDKVRRLVDDARTRGVSAFRQVAQRFPSGLELPMEYTAVRLGRKGGLIAVGKNLQAVAELQSRLVEAQQAMERDYWKRREVETRYRLLFDASNEAVLLVRAANLHVVEANPLAIRAIGFAPVGRDLLAELAPQDREAFQAMLLRAREHGKAPGILVHLGRDRQPWLVRASSIAGPPGPFYLLQLAPVGTSPALTPVDPVSVEELIERAPDGFVVVDRSGSILRANQAFLDLVQVGAKTSVVGERLSRWLGRPGADMTVLMAHLQRHGVVRLFSTTLHGELGTETEVELSAAAVGGPEAYHLGVIIRDVGQRLPSGVGRVAGVLGALGGQIGKRSLRKVVEDAVGAVERHHIEAALELTGGNRTAAAEILGLSRQSLYAKLDRYGLDGDAEPSPRESA